MNHAQQGVFPEHSRNTPEHPTLCSRSAPYVVGAPEQSGSVPGTWISPKVADEFTQEPCPVCGAPSWYDIHTDRFYHLDGTDMKPCVLALLRGGDLERIVPHALYWFWGGSELLYVGITLDPSTRWRDHERGKPWWHEVTTIAINRYPTRESVLAAEKRAIRTRKPKYNVVHNRGSK